MVPRKFSSTDAPARHPRGRAIVVIATLVVVLLILGLGAAAFFLLPSIKPPEVKAAKKTNTSTISPRVLRDSPSPRGEKR